MSAAPLDPDIVELATLYAAGVLPPAEMDAFESRLLASDPACVAAFERIRPFADLAARAAAPAEPRLIQRSHLINALGLKKAPPPFSSDSEASRRPDPFADDPADMVLLRAAHADWVETGVPGVQSRNLWVDRERARATVLLRLAPGVVYPDHDHPGVEECLVIQGDLELGGKVMLAGDYMRIPAGGQHGTPRTTGGCLLLVTTPLVAA
ncbi:MAG: cupin domain-containing protein [Phycisphaerales bacterium]